RRIRPDALGEEPRARSATLVRDAIRRQGRVREGDRRHRSRAGPEARDKGREGVRREVRPHLQVPPEARAVREESRVPRAAREAHRVRREEVQYLGRALHLQRREVAPGVKLDAFITSLAIEHAGDYARRCEADGYHGLWITETQVDPLLPLAVAATTTERLRLGTGITVALARSPMVTTMDAWAIQRASRGRLDLGLGTQVKAHIERRFSM